jgi:branched-chain amino acid transport system permease protein
MKRNQWVMIGCLGVAGIILPFGVRSPVWMTVLNLFFYYAMLSISWNIVFGFAGLFSFGHVAFAAVGGYASGLISIHLGLSPFWGLLIGGISCALIGVVLGGIVLRVRGFYLCLLTWAFAEVVNVVIKTEHRITGGTGGLITPGFFSGPQADFYSYFVGLGLFLLMFVFSALLFHSRPGLYLFAVRDDLDAAETMGVNTRLWKVLGFACGGFWAGVAGAYYAHFFGLIDPSIGGLDEMGKICLMVIVGGVGTIYGPLLGTFFVVILAEVIRGSLAEMSLLIFALVMILTMRFIRGGFMELIDLLTPRVMKRFSRAVKETDST